MNTDAMTRPLLVGNAQPFPGRLPASQPFYLPVRLPRPQIIAAGAFLGGM